MECTYNSISLDKLKRIQDLVKILDLKTFKFIFCHKIGSMNEYCIKYMCSVEEDNKLGQYLYNTELQPIFKKPNIIVYIFKKLLKRTKHKRYKKINI